MKDIKRIGLFLVAVKAVKGNIYAATLDGDILVYSNPLTTNKSDLVQRHIGARSKIVRLLPFGADHLLLLDSGGRVLNHNVNTRFTDVCAPEIGSNVIITGFTSGNSQLVVLTANGALWIY